MSPEAAGRWRMAAAVAVGAILAAAAALKGADLLHGRPVHLGPWPLPPTLAAAAAAWEGLVGLWLAAGPRSGRARLVAILTCAVLAGLAGALAVSGGGDCGCFGRRPVPSRLVLPLDLAMLAALLAGGGAGAPSGWRHRLAGIAIAIAAAGAALLVPMPPAAAAEARRNDDLRTATVALAGIAELSTGEWTVVLFSSTCPACREALPEWTAAARRAAIAGNGGRWAFVRIDGATDPEEVATLPATVLRRRLDVAVATPLAIRLRHGRAEAWGRQPGRLRPPPP